MREGKPVVFQTCILQQNSVRNVSIDNKSKACFIRLTNAFVILFLLAFLALTERHTFI